MVVTSSHIRQRVPVEPGEGVECLLCGDYMRVLAPHIRMHGLTTREYRERFPGAPLAGEIHRAIARDIHDDQVADGTSSLQQKKDVCKRGHRMTPGNVYESPSGNRRCRQCHREYTREWKKRKRKAKPEEVRAKGREYAAIEYERHREKVIARVGSYQRKNRAKRNAYLRKWRQARRSP